MEIATTRSRNRMAAQRLILLIVDFTIVGV
jgi:hypothetical protein